MQLFRNKQIWIIPLVTALIVAGVGWWGEGRLRRLVQQEIQTDLETTLQANATALEIWMSSQKRVAAALAEEPRFKALALELIEQHRSVPNPAVVNEISRQLLLKERFGERLRTLGYPYAQVVGTNFQVISDNARGRGQLGSPVVEDLAPRYRELFTKGEPLIITPFRVRRPEPVRRPPPEQFNAFLRMFFGSPNVPAPSAASRRPAPATKRRDPTLMQVAAPIRDDQGIIQGALVLVINPDAEFTRILSVARPGESGETFAFDAEGVMLSKSRFDDELKRLKLIEDAPDATSALNLHLRDPGENFANTHIPDANGPLILMVERALTGGSGSESEPFRDYRGVQVVGAWRWLEKYGFGIGTKMDAQEAYHTLRTARSVFIVLFLLLLLAAVVILVYSYSQVLWRRRVTEAELKARQLGQYRLIEKIGEGGMGLVYKAHHALLRRETAIKLLPPGRTEPAAIRRFEQEVQLTCRLSHPNTIQIFDYGHTPDGVFYYAMEYLDGLNLADLTAQYGTQPEERIIHILRQVCDALSEAHAMGLIHRDIKPANIFLSDRGGVPDCVKVLDFGLVKHLGGGTPQKPQAERGRGEGIVGTPNFIAPEAIEDPDKADARSDLYSVGTVAYYLMTGRHVFEGDSIATVSRRHVTETPVTPGTRIGRSFDPQFEALIMRCLDKDPAGRPQSARELGDALAACPPASRWTLERRTAWWRTFRRTSEQLITEKRPPSSTLEKTVRIDIEERQP